MCLAELGVIDRSNAAKYYPWSMKFYFLQNLFGALHDLVLLGLEIMKQGKEEHEKYMKKIKNYAFDLIRNLLDCLVALFYWKGGLPAKKIGILGVITSLISIIQILGLV